MVVERDQETGEAPIEETNCVFTLEALLVLRNTSEMTQWRFLATLVCSCTYPNTMVTSLFRDYGETTEQKIPPVSLKSAVW